MAEEKMTLVERLRNPQWVHGPREAGVLELDPEQTLKDMTEAAESYERVTVERDAWKIIAKQNAQLAALTPTEQTATLEKALEAEIADHMKTRDELDELKRQFAN